MTIATMLKQVEEHIVDFDQMLDQKMMAEQLKKLSDGLVREMRGDRNGGAAEKAQKLCGLTDQLVQLKGGKPKRGVRDQLESVERKFTNMIHSLLLQEHHAIVHGMEHFDFNEREATENQWKRLTDRMELMKEIRNAVPHPPIDEADLFLMERDLKALGKKVEEHLETLAA